MTNYTGGSVPIVNFGGRNFYNVGAGTIGWQVIEFYQEVDAAGNDIGRAAPLAWHFPEESRGEQQQKGGKE